MKENDSLLSNPQGKISITKKISLHIIFEYWVIIDEWRKIKKNKEENKSKEEENNQKKKRRNK